MGFFVEQFINGSGPRSAVSDSAIEVPFRVTARSVCVPFNVPSLYCSAILHQLAALVLVFRNYIFLEGGSSCIVFDNFSGEHTRGACGPCERVFGRFLIRIKYRPISAASVCALGSGQRSPVVVVCSCIRSIKNERPVVTARAGSGCPCCRDTVCSFRPRP